jgi:hypothetical protein
LTKLLLEDLLEVSKTAVHVHVVRAMLLGFVVAVLCGSVELGAAAGLEWLLESTLGGFELVVLPLGLGSDRVHAEGLLEFVELLGFYAIFDILHILSEPDLQVLQF